MLRFTAVIFMRYIFVQIDEQMGFANQEGLPLSSNLNENELDLAAQNPSGRQILMNLDPWISPYRLSFLYTFTSRSN